MTGPDSSALRQAERTPLEGFFEASGARLHYLAWPGARPAVGVPGFAASARSFQALGEALADGPGLLALDLRGRGLSDSPATGYGLDRHLDDLLAFLDSRQLDRADLIGHSFGALIVLAFAARHPSRVARVVLIDGGAPIPDAIHAAVSLVLQRLDLVYPSIDAYLRLLRAAPFLQPWNAYLEGYFRADVEPLPGGAVRPRARRAPLELDQCLIQEVALDFDALWASVECPLLALRARQGFTGGSDWVIRPDDWVRLLRNNQAANGVEVDANHYTILFNPPAQVPATIAAFLAGSLDPASAGPAASCGDAPRW